MIRSKKGFTLMEMLIVVAIIGILVAIVIPVYAAAAEKTKEKVDDSNVRAARAAIITSYLNGTLNGDGVTQVIPETWYNYDNTTCRLVNVVPEPYGQGTTRGEKAEDNTGCYIRMKVNEHGEPTIEWIK